VIVDGDRPTTLKERFWANGYKMLQVDRVDNRIVSRNIVDQIIEKMNERENDIVVFSDFRHGIFNKETIGYFRKAIKGNTIIAADSQVSNRWGNILDFKNVDLIFPNEKEARFALGDQDTGIRPLALNLYNRSNSKYLILKMGEKGILVYRKPGEKPRDFFIIDSFAENVVDGVGAGDAMLAVTSLGYKCSKNILISTILGNIAAAITCEKEGNIPVTVDEIGSRLEKIVKEGELKL
jgi:bifunctional ADP-heptose synthase (sugar kinase/adenylyltransferase)